MMSAILLLLLIVAVMANDDLGMVAYEEQWLSMVMRKDLFLHYQELLDKENSYINQLEKEWDSQKSFIIYQST